MGEIVRKFFPLCQQALFPVHVLFQFPVGLFQGGKCLLQVFRHFIQACGQLFQFIPGVHGTGRGKVQPRHPAGRPVQPGDRLRDKTSHQIIQSQHQEDDEPKPQQESDIRMERQPGGDHIGDDQEESCQFGDYNNSISYTSRCKCVFYFHAVTSNL